MIERNRSQTKIVEDQAREALRRISLNNEALEEQLKIARDFVQEEARAENKRIAYELAEFGIDRISEIDAIDDQVGFGKVLRKQLAEAKSDSSKVDDIDSFLDSMDQ